MLTVAISWPILLLYFHIKEKLFIKHYLEKEQEMMNGKRENPRKHGERTGERFQLGFDILPFEPDCRQIIYVEGTYNKDINEFISKNYHRIAHAFKKKGYEFVYLPILNDMTEDRIRYNIPYIAPNYSYKPSLDSGFLLNFMFFKENKELVNPSLVAYSHINEDMRIFEGWGISEKCDNIFDFEFLCAEICRELDYNRKHSILFSVPLDEVPSASARFSGSTVSNRQEDHLDSSFKKGNTPKYSLSEESEACISAGCVAEMEVDVVDVLIKNLQRSVEKLQLKGITLAAIHDLIDKNEKISRLLITNDFRIFLPDYNNMEIEMGDLPKALFFTFLNHPEGIVIKNISDYYNEIFNIYRQFKPNFKEESLRVSVTKLTNPLSNGINENIARIRCAFVKKFDEHLAKNYIVTGKKGEPYSIPLDRKLVEWEDEPEE